MVIVRSVTYAIAVSVTRVNSTIVVSCNFLSGQILLYILATAMERLISARVVLNSLLL